MNSLYFILPSVFIMEDSAVVEEDSISEVTSSIRIHGVASIDMDVWKTFSLAGY